LLKFNYPKHQLLKENYQPFVNFLFYVRLKKVKCRNWHSWSWRGKFTKIEAAVYS